MGRRNGEVQRSFAVFVPAICCGFDEVFLHCGADCVLVLVEKYQCFGALSVVQAVGVQYGFYQSTVKRLILAAEGRFKKMIRRKNFTKRRFVFFFQPFVKLLCKGKFADVHYGSFCCRKVFEFTRFGRIFFQELVQILEHTARRSRGGNEFRRFRIVNSPIEEFDVLFHRLLFELFYAVVYSCRTDSLCGRKSFDEIFELLLYGIEAETVSLDLFFVL